MAKFTYESDYRHLAASLKDARVRAGRDQLSVATELGVHQSFVSKYESAERSLDVVEFVVICGVLNLDPSAEISKIRRRPRLRPK